MGIKKPIARTGLLMCIAALTYAAAQRDWKQGTLVSAGITTTPDKGVQRYEFVVSDGTFLYTIDYEHPLKTAVHHSVKFMIEKDTLVLVDADSKERPAHIKKRERLLIDSPIR